MTNQWRDPILINTIGHTAGVLLFGFIIALLLRDWRVHGVKQARLSLLAATLALGWNLCSLMFLASADPASTQMAFLAAVSFSMLSLLPAVLLEVASLGRHVILVGLGYGASTCAIGLHVWEPFSSPRLHQAALATIVIGFGILTPAVFLLEYRRRSSAAGERPEWISFAGLLLFTSSFLHFGYQHGRTPWAAEVTWHHVELPVALIVLLRDYRFLLLDTFIRFLLNSGLAAAYVAAILWANEKFHLWDRARASLFSLGLGVVALCLSLIVFAYLRNRLQDWVNRVILRRQNVEDCLISIGKLAGQARTEEELVAGAAERVAGHLGTRFYALVGAPSQERATLSPTVLLEMPTHTTEAGQSFRIAAQVPLRFAGGDTRYLLFGAQGGGRRYQAGDLEDMRRLAAATVEQVERFRAEELRRLVDQAELRALQAQINPHFLFNALNTLYGTIDRGSQDARRMVLNLAEIFRYFLHVNGPVIPLSEEVRIIEAYLEIEALRLGRRLKTHVEIGDEARSALIPILSVQPLVENAVKHGVAARQEGGRVSVKAHKLPAGILISVEDTGLGMEKRGNLPHDGTGLGLENVRRRLALCFGAGTDLSIQSNSEGTRVSFLVPSNEVHNDFKK